VPLTRDLQPSVGAITVASCSYVVALIYPLVSTYYAVLARRSEAFVTMSASNAQDLLARPVRDRIALRLAYARWNEVRLLHKATRLSVAEDLFLITIAFLAFASCVALMAHLTRV